MAPKNEPPELSQTSVVRGRFIRPDTHFHHVIQAYKRQKNTTCMMLLFRATNRWLAATTNDFIAQPNRYHLYVSYACPWAHRAMIVRKLKGLENVISMDICDWLMKDTWLFNAERAGCTPDTISGFKTLREVYEVAQSGYRGKYTVPVLWDKKTKTIVNNESAEIIRMLNGEFNLFCTGDAQKKLDLYPEELRTEIDIVNEWIYRDINDGVYKCGFAKTRSSFIEAATGLFRALEKVEKILANSRYLVGNRFTEADVRLFTTLIRFDLVYATHFKCDRKRLIDFPNMWAYTREIYQMPGVAETVNFDHIKNHYYQCHRSINPDGIVPIGPVLDFKTEHGRDKLFPT